MLVNKKNKIKRIVEIYWLSFHQLQPVCGWTCLFEGQSSWLFVGHLSTEVFWKCLQTRNQLFLVCFWSAKLKFCFSLSLWSYLFHSHWPRNIWGCKSHCSAAPQLLLKTAMLKGICNNWGKELYYLYFWSSLLFLLYYKNGQLVTMSNYFSPKHTVHTPSPE